MLEPCANWYLNLSPLIEGLSGQLRYLMVPAPPNNHGPDSQCAVGVRECCECVLSGRQVGELSVQIHLPPMDHGPQGKPGDTKCVQLSVPENVCYVRFADNLDGYDGSKELGTTVRGESVIADFDREGRIIGLELFAWTKPCQK